MVSIPLESITYSANKIELEAISQKSRQSHTEKKRLEQTEMSETAKIARQIER